MFVTMSPGVTKSKSSTNANVVETSNEFFVARSLSWISLLVFDQVRLFMTAIKGEGIRLSWLSHCNGDKPMFTPLLGQASRTFSPGQL